jgi:hypothetical protein
MENRTISENYTINSQIFVPILIDEASLKESKNSITFKLLAKYHNIGWIAPFNEELNIKNLKPFKLKHYMDIIFKYDSFTEIAMYLYTKDNIYYSLKPYLYEDKIIIFQ